MSGNSRRAVIAVLVVVAVVGLTGWVAVAGQEADDPLGSPGVGLAGVESVIDSYVGFGEIGPETELPATEIAARFQRAFAIVGDHLLTCDPEAAPYTRRTIDLRTGALVAERRGPSDCSLLAWNGQVWVENGRLEAGFASSDLDDYVAVETGQFAPAAVALSVDGRRLELRRDGVGGESQALDLGGERVPACSQQFGVSDGAGFAYAVSETGRLSVFDLSGEEPELSPTLVLGLDDPLPGVDADGCLEGFIDVDDRGRVAIRPGGPDDRTFVLEGGSLVDVVEGSLRWLGELPIFDNRPYPRFDWYPAGTRYSSDGLTVMRWAGRGRFSVLDLSPWALGASASVVPAAEPADEADEVRVSLANPTNRAVPVEQAVVSIDGVGYSCQDPWIGVIGPGETTVCRVEARLERGRLHRVSVGFDTRGTRVNRSVGDLSVEHRPPQWSDGAELEVAALELVAEGAVVEVSWRSPEWGTAGAGQLRLTAEGVDHEHRRELTLDGDARSAAIAERLPPGRYRLSLVAESSSGRATAEPVTIVVPGVRPAEGLAVDCFRFDGDCYWFLGWEPASFVGVVERGYKVVYERLDGRPPTFPLEAVDGTVIELDERGFFPVSALGADRPAVQLGALEPGRYRFEVQSRSERGVVRSDALELTLDDTPDLWLLDGAGGLNSVDRRSLDAGDRVALGMGEPVDLAVPDGASGPWVLDAGGQISGADSVTGLSESVGEPVVALAPTGDGAGAWMVTATGRVLTVGSATHHGDLAGLALNAPVVGMAAAADGYWLVAADGGVFAFGGAGFHGSLGGLALNAPVVDLVSAVGGYHLVAADGGVFSFGSVEFPGSLAEQALPAPVVAASG